MIEIPQDCQEFFSIVDTCFRHAIHCGIGEHPLPEYDPQQQHGTVNRLPVELDRIESDLCSVVVYGIALIPFAPRITPTKIKNILELPSALKVESLEFGLHSKGGATLTFTIRRKA